MSKSAIIKIGPFQYNVTEGETYEVPNFDAEAGKNFEVQEVLLVNNGKTIEIGTPVLKNVKVTLEVLEQKKGEKVVSKIFKAKSRYRRTRGFRKLVTKFKVASIK